MLTVEQHMGVFQRIYNQMQHRGFDSVFWDRDVPMGFYEFVTQHHPQAGTVAFAINHLSLYGDIDLVGFMSLSGFIENHRAMISIWIDPKMRGVNSHWIGKQAISFCHTKLNLDNIYAMSPWRHAQEYCLRVGLAEVAEIPNFCRSREKVRDVKVFHSEKTLWKQQIKEELDALGWLPSTSPLFSSENLGDTNG